MTFNCVFFNDWSAWLYRCEPTLPKEIDLWISFCFLKIITLIWILASHRLSKISSGLFSSKLISCFGYSLLLQQHLSFILALNFVLLSKHFYHLESSHSFTVTCQDFIQHLFSFVFFLLFLKCLQFLFLQDSFLFGFFKGNSFLHFSSLLLKKLQLMSLLIWTEYLPVHHEFII